VKPIKPQARQRRVLSRVTTPFSLASGELQVDFRQQGEHCIMLLKPTKVGSTASPSPSHAGVAGFTIELTTEQLIAAVSLFWLISANQLFFTTALKGSALTTPATWGFAIALAVMVFSLQFFLLSLVGHRAIIKPLVALLLVTTASAAYFMQAYGVYFDPSMVRNILRTDVAEAREIVSWRLVLHFALYAALPLVLLWRVQLVRRPVLRAAAHRLGWSMLALVLSAGAVLAVFQPFASLMRNHKEVRYLITPANLAWSVSSVAGQSLRGAGKPRQPIGLDATRAAPAAGARPQLLVVVVGETARAANWGLSGYARQTTPQLATLVPQGLTNFPQVTSCGTNTEVSVPCMFAPVGRRNYNEADIRGSESLLHVLARTGVAVQWRDNQSGCKGVCDGLPTESTLDTNLTSLCAEGRCLDAALLDGLDARLDAAKGTQVLVLHMLGNHGPSYFRRYPPQFAKFAPFCQSDDLAKCTREEIVNAYDNALLYTDDVLAQLIARLQSRASSVDSSVIYVSDHGESLGEKGLFLHGMPYAIAPGEQTQVPMVTWFSVGMQRSLGLDSACLKARAMQPASHDHLFHSVLGMMNVKTALYEPQLDLFASCRAVQTVAAGLP
jgi:lipid A ethanolaminephosphotransferase